jgi:long-subunit acyl-CoA synthetase (AMP-forming)
MLGYYKDPANTEAVLSKDGWLRTGDLGYLSDDGYLFVKGRLKNMLLGPSGENIFPEEIEAVLGRFELVLESVVTQHLGALVARVHVNREILEKQYSELKNRSEKQFDAFVQEHMEEIRRSVNKRVASFVGFLPAEAPRVVMLVTIDEPKKGVYGGLTAAPVFSRIAAQAMQYLKVAPNQETPAGQSLPSLEQIFVDAVAPEEASLQHLLVKTASDGPQMPDFSGLSFRQVLELMEEKQLNVDFRGRGRVVEQSPVPGASIPYGAPVWVRMVPPS